MTPQLNLVDHRSDSTKKLEKLHKLSDAIVRLKTIRDAGDMTHTLAKSLEKLERARRELRNTARLRLI